MFFVTFPFFVFVIFPLFVFIIFPFFAFIIFPLFVFYYISIFCFYISLVCFFIIFPHFLFSFYCISILINVFFSVSLHKPNICARSRPNCTKSFRLLWNRWEVNYPLLQKSSMGMKLMQTNEKCIATFCSSCVL